MYWILIKYLQNIFAFSQEVGKNEPGVLHDSYSSQQQST